MFAQWLVQKIKPKMLFFGDMFKERKKKFNKKWKTHLKAYALVDAYTREKMTSMTSQRQCLKKKARKK